MTSEEAAAMAQREAEDAALMALKLAPEGAAAAPAQRPSIEDRQTLKRMEEIAAFAADTALGALLTAYAGAQAATLSTTAYDVPEVREIRQLTAMADRLGQRALASFQVKAERG